MKVTTIDYTKASNMQFSNTDPNEVSLSRTKQEKEISHANSQKASLSRSLKTAIVTREAVTVKRSNNFSTDILDINLNQKVNQKDTSLALYKRTAVNNLPDLSHAEGRASMWNTILGNIEKFLKISRSQGLLTKDDFNYILKRLYSANGQHEIGKGDPAIFETLKYTTQNQQKLLPEFIHILEKILKREIVTLDFVPFGTMHWKDTTNVLTASWLNRTSLRYPENPKNIGIHIRMLAPQILFNFAQNGQTLDKNTIGALLRGLEGSIDEHDTIICALGIAARNTEQNLSEFCSQIHNAFRDGKQSLPEVKSAFLELRTRYGYAISDNEISFLEKTLNPLKSSQDAEFFFGYNNNIRECNIWERRDEWFLPSYYSVLKFYSLTVEGTDLTKGELIYLSEQIKQDYIGDTDLIKNYDALLTLKHASRSGQILPQETICVLESQLSQSQVRDRHIKKLLTLILGFALRNKQTVSDKALQEMNAALDHGRTSAAFALGYYVEKSGISKLQPTTMQKLQDILGNTQNSVLKESVTFAINSISKQNARESVIGLENELLKTPELAATFFHAALQKQILVPHAIINLAKICNMFTADENRFNASLTLSQAAQNEMQQIPHEVISYCTNIIKDSDCKISSNIASFLGHYAKKNAQALCNKQILNRLCDIALREDNAVSSSFALESIAQNMISEDNIASFARIVPKLTELLIDTHSVSIDARHNIALALAHAAKKCCTFDNSAIAKLAYALLHSDQQEITKSILSTLGYCAKNLRKEMFGDIALSNIIHALNSDDKKISDSARSVLEIYLPKASYQLSQSVLKNLAYVACESNASFNASCLLKQLIENNILLPLDAIDKLSKSLGDIVDFDSLINISFVFMQLTKQVKFTEDILSNIEWGLNYEEQEIIENITAAIKHSAKQGVKLSENLIIKLSDFLADDSIFLNIKQNVAWAIGFGINKNQAQIEQVVHILKDSINLNDIEISQAAMLALGNYFTKAFKLLSNELNEEIVEKLEEHFNNVNFLEHGIYAMSAAVKRGGYQLSERTLETVASVLIEYPDTSTRNNARNILAAHNKCTIPYVQNILQIEEAANAVFQNPSIEGLNVLRNLAKDGNQLTLSSFEVLVKLVNQQKYTKEICDILNAVAKNEQKLPDFVMNAVVSEFTQLFDIKQVAGITEALWHASRNSASLAEGLVETVEKQIAKGHIDEYLLSILHLSAKRNVPVSNTTLLKLSTLLSWVNLQMRDKIVEIIAYTIPNLRYVDNELIANLSNCLDISDYSTSLIKQALDYRPDVTAISKKAIQFAAKTPIDLYPTLDKTGSLEEKDLLTLLAELKRQNNNSEILSYLSDNRLLNHIRDIEIAYQNGSNFIDSFMNLENYSLNFKNILQTTANLLVNNNNIQAQLSKPIKCWQEKDIEDWARCFKNSYQAIHNKEATFSEMIAVIKRAIVLHSQKSGEQHELRTVQLISSLIMMQSKNSRLAQIATGEGKSTIISVLAVIQALQGKKVDVITSSMVLAKRDAQEKASFYKMFSLSTMHNGDDSYNFKGLKSCYAKDVDIIYGDAANFQFDVLREEYSDLGTRGNRAFDNAVAIVDEVDSMFIDDSSKIAMLSDTMPGMSSLNILFTAIWQELERIELRFEKNDSKLLYQRPLQSNGSNQIEYESVEITDTVPVYWQFVKDELIRYATDLVRDISSAQSEIKIPEHFIEFARKQCSKWATSAVEAKSDLYKKGRDYLIKKDNKGIDRITPVDFANTGVVQTSTTWGDGLHQFLQVKEGLKLTPETLITNFLSNKAYFLRYNKILGLTGTLGSKPAKELLHELYDADFVEIPRYKYRHFQEQDAVITHSQEAWLDAILATTTAVAKNNRASLVICETMEQADLIFKELTTKYRAESHKGKIIAYTRDDNSETKAIENKLNAGDIIVATNLAGRGTDIRLAKEVTDKGGLHVCVTFLPNNLRVEEQAFGRAARQGQSGTAQLILNRESLDIRYTDCNTIDQIRKCRDDLEMQKLANFKDNELVQINLKDELFADFCSILRDLRTKVNNNEELSVILHDHKMQAINERWGLFLKELDLTNDTQVRTEFKKFKDQILEDYQSDSVIKNPSYYIRYGNALMAHADDYKTKALNAANATGSVALHFSTYGLIDASDKVKEWWEYKDKVYKLAQDAFTKAIEMAPEHAYAAYYKRAYTFIELEGRFYKAGYSYKDQAKSDLRKAADILKNHFIPQLMSTQLNFGTNGTTNTDSEFYQQAANKINILKSLSESIHNSILVITKSQKLIEVLCNGQNFDSLDAKAAFDKINQFSDSEDISIKFHDLKTHFDIKMASQVGNTVDNVLKRYHDIQDINIKFDGLSQDQAIELLPSFMSKQSANINADVNKQKEWQTGEFEALNWLNKGKAYAKDAGKLIKNKASNVSHFISDNARKVKNATYDGWYGFEKAKKIPVTLTLKNISSANAIKILNEVKSTQKVKVEIGLGDSQQQHVEYVPKQHGIEFILEFENQIRSNIKENIRSNDELKGLDIDVNNLEKHQMEGIGVKLTLDSLSQEQAKRLIELSDANNIDLHYENLNQKSVKRIVYATSDYTGDATLVFNKLNAEQAKCIVEHADREEQGVRIQEIKKVGDLFLSTDSPVSEIAEAKADGLDGIMYLYEQQPIKVVSCATVGALGVGQIIAGCVFIAVPEVGTVLISEGVGDIITAVRGAISRNFSWDDYAIQKSISISISLATAGFRKIGGLTNTKNISTAKTAVESVDDQVGRAILTSTEKSGIQASEKIAIKETTAGTTQISTQCLSKATQDHIKVASKHALTQLLESGAKEVLNAGVDKFSDMSMQYLKSQINERVELALTNGSFNHSNVNKAISIDKYLQSQNYQNTIQERANRILNPRHNKLVSSLKGITSGVIARNSKSIGNLIQPLDTAAQMTSALAKTSTVVESFNQDFTNYLDKMELPKVSDLIFSNTKLSSEESERVLVILQQNKIIQNDFINPDSIKATPSKFEFDRQMQVQLPRVTVEQAKPKLQQFVLKDFAVANIEDINLDKSAAKVKDNIKTLHNLTKASHSVERNMLHKKISTTVANQMIATIQGGLIKPLTSMAINKAVQKASESLQKHFNNGRTVLEEVDAFQKSKNLMGKYKNWMQQLSEEEKQKYAPLMEQAIEEAKTGKGNILHLTILIDELEKQGESIKIVLHKDGQYYDTMGDQNSKKVIILNHSKDHWNFYDQNVQDFKDAIPTGNQNNDCLFDAIAGYTNSKTAEDLRNMVAFSLANNSDYYINFMPAYNTMCTNPDLFGGLWSGGCTDCHNVTVSTEEFYAATLDGKQILIKKTWYKEIKDLCGTTKTVTFAITAVGTIAIIVSGGTAAPIAVPIMTYARYVDLAANAVDAANELHGTANEHGVISKEFGKEILNQVMEKGPELVTMATNLKILKEHSKLTSKINKIAGNIAFIQNISNEPNSEKVSQKIDTKIMKEEIRDIIKDIKITRRQAPKSEQPNLNRATGALSCILNCLELYENKDDIINVLFDPLQNNTIKDIQNTLNNEQKIINNPEALKLFKQNIEQSGEYEAVPNISIQALTERQQLQAEAYYGDIWNKLNNTSKSIILAHAARYNEFLDVSNSQNQYSGGDMNTAILVQDQNDSRNIDIDHDPTANAENGLTPINIYRYENALANNIKTVLNNPDKKHVFCKNETDMLKNAGYSDQNIEKHYNDSSCMIF